MTRREERFLNAIQHCVENGEYSVDHAIVLIEDQTKYGWMSDGAKDAFYEWVDAWEAQLWRQGVDERAQHAQTSVVSVVYAQPEPGEEDPDEETGEDPDGEPAEDEDRDQEGV